MAGRNVGKSMFQLERINTMSVDTEADENLAKAKMHIKEAVKALSSIVVDECEGYDEYNLECEDAFTSAFYTLCDMQKSLRS